MTRKESGWVSDAMEQAQVFASAWSLVGGRFDDGSMIDTANEEKEALERMLTSLQSAAEGLEEALHGLIDYFPNGATFERLGFPAKATVEAHQKARAAISAFDRLKEKQQ